MSDQTSVIVERASLDDIDAITPLFDGYRQFYQQPSNLAAAREFLAARLAADELVIFVARQGGAPLGFTQLFPSFSSVSLRRLWILNDLFVAPSARGLGVGSALLTRARTWAAETGAKGLVLETAVDNPAQQLYIRHGYQLDSHALHLELTL